MRLFTISLAAALSVCSCTSHNSMRRLYIQALADQRDGRPDAARSGYENIVDAAPTFEGARNNLAVLAVGDGELDRAIALLSAELTVHPGLAAPRINEVLVGLLAAGVDPQTTRRKALGLVGSFPDNPLAHLTHGLALLRTNGDLEIAHKALKRAGASKSVRVRAQAAFATGVLRARQGRYEPAAQEFAEAGRLRRDAVAHYNRALMLAALNDHEKALTEVALAGALDDSAAPVPHLAAMLHHRLKQSKEALAQTQKALALEPKRRGLQLLAGVIHLDAHRVEQAKAAFEAELANHPKSGDAWFNLAMTRIERDELEAAMVAFGKAAELDPKDSQAVHNRDVLAKLLGPK